MNERGFASFTAILIMSMLTYLIRGLIFAAGNYVDMTKNLLTENRLQLAAESALCIELKSLDGKTEEDVKAAINTYPHNLDLNGVDKIIVTARMLADGKVVILAVAKKDNHFADGINAYRSVGAFLIKNPAPLNTDPPDTIYKYKFEGYLHKPI